MDYQCSCRIGFKIICIVGTVCMVGYWFYKFAAEDRDIGVVDYESFEESEKIHFPVITFCFENVFLSKQMLETNWKINVTKYMQYLKGDHYDDDYDRINYWNVTIDLNKYFLYGEAQWNNDTSYHNDTLTFTHTENFNGLYPEGEFHKCFEVSSNIHQHRYVKKIILHYNKQALLADTEIDSFDVYFNIHHSGQFLLAPNDPSYLSIQDGVKKSFIWIEDMESLRSRISHSRTCTPQKGDVSYDGMVSREHIIQQGCRPPYLQPHANIPSCNTHEKMNHSVYAFKRVRKKYLPIACERMSKIYWVYEEHNYEHDKNATWSFSITYPDYARVIIQSKEVDIHTLVGNIGGYVGLFLGNIRKDYIRIMICHPKKEMFYRINI